MHLIINPIAFIKLSQDKRVKLINKFLASLCLGTAVSLATTPAFSAIESKPETPIPTSQTTSTAQIKALDLTQAAKANIFKSSPALKYGSREAIKQLLNFLYKKKNGEELSADIEKLMAKLNDHLAGEIGG